jgi:hypothetical protein
LRLEEQEEEKGRGSFSSYYNAFGENCSISGKLDWKTPIFPGRTLWKTPNAS